MCEEIHLIFFFFFFRQDVFELRTPGGGGYGSSNSDDDSLTPKDNENGKSHGTFVERGSVFEYRQAQESV